MTTIKPITIPGKRLSKTIDGTKMTFKLDDIKGWDGNDLTPSDFGTIAYASFRNSDGTSLELMKIDPSTIADSEITILLRGLKFNADDETEVSANKLTWIKGDTIVELGSHLPQLFDKYVNTLSDQSIQGIKTFASFPKKSGSVTPTSSDEFATKSYVDSVVGGTAVYDQQVYGAIAGETLTSGNIVYFKTSDQKWYKANASSTSTSRGVLIGIAQNGAAADASVNVLLGGLDKTQSGLTAGDDYYLSDTPGVVSDTPGTVEVFLGKAQSSTEMLFVHINDQETVTADEKDSLQTQSGLGLSSDNRVLDEGLTTNGATYTASTIAFVDSDPDTITDTANGFVTAGFKRGHEITISGSASNDGTYRVKSVSAGTITLITSETLSVEAAGNPITISVKKDDKILQLKSDGALPPIDVSDVTGNPALDGSNFTNLSVFNPSEQVFAMGQNAFNTPTNTDACIGIGSNADGSVIYVLATDQNQSQYPILERYVVDSVTGTISITHSVQLYYSTGSVQATQIAGLTVVGSYLYITTRKNTSSTVETRRVLEADLTGNTLMSYSGGSPTNLDYKASFSDDTDLYISDTGTTYKKYSISGTTLTFVSNVTFDSATSNPRGAVYSSSDSKVYMLDYSSSRLYIYKYAITGGAPEATSIGYDYNETFPFFGYNRDNSRSTGLAIASDKALYMFNSAYLYEIDTGNEDAIVIQTKPVKRPV